MEIKKTVAADLERRRTRGFLLGLAVATLIFFAALQIPINNDDMELSDDMLNEIVEDMEMMPAIDQHDQIALEKEKKETVSDRIKEVDKEEIAEVEIADDSNIVNLHNWSMGSFSGIDMADVAVLLTRTTIR